MESLLVGALSEQSKVCSAIVGLPLVVQGLVVLVFSSVLKERLFGDVLSHRAMIVSPFGVVGPLVR